MDEQALYEALSGKRLAGAACDVFVKEPPDAGGLVSLENFIAAPHIGFGHPPDHPAHGPDGG